MAHKAVRGVSVLNRVFTDLAESLGIDLDSAGVSSKGYAKTNTNKNFNAAVARFLAKCLPVACAVKESVQIVDAFGNESGDVDIAIANPWAVPIWRIKKDETNVIPVEGILTAIFAEARFSKNDDSTKVYQQAARTKKLLKWLLQTEGYSVPARRTYRVEVGIICSRAAGKTTGKTMMEAIRVHWPQFDDALRESADQARARNWKSPSSRTDTREPEQMTPDYEAYQRLVGAMAPNWFYIHRPSILLIKFQARSGLQLKKYEDLVVVSPHPVEVLVPKFDDNGKWTGITSTKDDLAFSQVSPIPQWGYACFYGPKAVATLALQLAYGTDLYGKERTNYAQYLAKLDLKRFRPN